MTCVDRKQHVWTGDGPHDRAPEVKEGRHTSQLTPFPQGQKNGAPSPTECTPSGAEFPLCWRCFAKHNPLSRLCQWLNAPPPHTHTGTNPCLCSSPQHLPTCKRIKASAVPCTLPWCLWRWQHSVTQFSTLWLNQDTAYRLTGEDRYHAACRGHVSLQKRSGTAVHIRHNTDAVFWEVIRHTSVPT